jgi:LacI family transcriptional regulator
VVQTVRMSDVAKRAGVSTMTVSRVLNENTNVLEETRQRVFAAVEELGYRRNELARSLRDRRSRQIGILVPNLYDPFFAVCTHAINTVAREHGYSVSTAMTEENPELEYEEASRMLRRSVEGLLVIPADVAGTSRLLAPDLSQVPIVTIDRPASGAARKLDAFLVENKEGGRLGTEHLLALGHKRILCVSLSRRVYTMRMRTSGYEAAMEAAGYAPSVLTVPETVEGTLEKLSPLMTGKRPPTAVFCANNLTTRHVLHALQNMGMHPPNPMALVGFDDFETADLLRPGVTVVSQPGQEMARQAAEALFTKLQAPDAAQHPKKVILPVQLIVRGSCGAAVA